MAGGLGGAFSLCSAVNLTLVADSSSGSGADAEVVVDAASGSVADADVVVDASFLVNLTAAGLLACRRSFIHRGVSCNSSVGSRTI